MRGIIPPGGKTYSADLIDNDGLSWVRKHSAEPFFLYFASTIPHLSLQVPDDSLAEYKGKWPEIPYRNTKHYANNENPRATYAAMITRFDRDIGRLLDLLTELKLDENTLIIFSSDNGAVFPIAGTDPVFFGSTGGLRGYKQDLYEGGIRAPFLARWKGRVKAGSTSDYMGAFWDIMPTFCEITGATPPADTDGISILPTLLGQPGQKQHDSLYWEYHSGGSAQAVRFGEWKAIRNGVKKNPDSTPELYNLTTRPSRDIERRCRTSGPRRESRCAHEVRPHPERTARVEFLIWETGMNSRRKAQKSAPGGGAVRFPSARSMAATLALDRR